MNTDQLDAIGHYERDGVKYYPITQIYTYENHKECVVAVYEDEEEIAAYLMKWREDDLNTATLEDI